MKDDKPFNWSKDFVEHLRTVHFALAAVSLALIIAISAQNRGLPIALSQIEQIARFEKGWPTVRSKVYDHVSRGAPEDWFFTLKGVISAKLYEARYTFVNVSIPHDKLATSYDWIFLDQQSWPNELSTLDDFRRFWNHMWTGFDVLIPHAPDQLTSCVLEVQTSDVVVEDTVSFPPRSDFLCSVERSLKLKAIATHLPHLDFDARFDTSRRDGQHVVLVVAEPFPQDNYPIAHDLPSDSAFQAVATINLASRRVHLTESVLDEVFFKEWGHGTFAEAFPELNAEAADLSTVDLADTMARVQLQATAASNSISLLGLMIPLIQLTRWGPLVLLATQLYFWLHLHELVRKIEPDADGWDVAWIGIYRTRPAFIVVLFSACVLPAVAAICLGVTFVTSHYYDRRVGVTGCSLVIVASVLLSAVTAARLFRLRAMVETENRETGSQNAEEVENC
jgi:hypothetical protein